MFTLREIIDGSGCCPLISLASIVDSLLWHCNYLKLFNKLVVTFIITDFLIFLRSSCSSSVQLCWSTLTLSFGQKRLYLVREFSQIRTFGNRMSLKLKSFSWGVFCQSLLEGGFLDQRLEHRGQWAQKTLCHTRQEKEAAVIGHLYPSVIAEGENMGKWLPVIMTIASISGFTWTVLNWRPFQNQRPGSVLSAKSNVEANLLELNVLTRFECEKRHVLKNAGHLFCNVHIWWTYVFYYY